MKNRKRSRSQIKRSAPLPRIHDHFRTPDPEAKEKALPEQAPDEHQRDLVKPGRGGPLGPPKIDLIRPEPPVAEPPPAGELPQTTTDPPTREVARINAISLVARTTWFGLLAYIAFVGITLLGVEDADFFVPSRQTQLPLVNVSIPTSSFFWFAPMLGAALYAYLHLQLVKLWEALAAPPPEINGKHLSELVYPWLISDYALARRKDDALKPRPLAALSRIVTWWLVWASAPLVLAGFWWRSMPRHDEWMTLGIAAAMMLATYVGVTSNWRATILLCRNGEQNARNSPWQGWLRRTWFATFCALVVVTTWLRTEGGFDHYANRVMEAWETATGKSIFKPGTFPNGDEKAPRFVRKEWVAANILTLQDLTHTFWPPFLDRAVSITPLAKTDLAGVNLVPNPDNLINHTTERRRFRQDWCDRQGMDLETCGRLYTPVDPAPGHLAQRRETWCSIRKIATPEDCTNYFRKLDGEFREEWRQLWSNRIAALGSLDLSGADLRAADLTGARLIGVNLIGARFENSDLILARLEGARFWEAQMENADFSGAQMKGAELSGAWLEGSEFNSARLEEADLSGARLEGAGFNSAHMEGSDLSGARLERANFTEARMIGADLSEARAEGATLIGARMERVSLSLARLEDAILRRAWLDEADLSGAQIQGADLRGARMVEADLSGARMEGANLNYADLKSVALTESFEETSVRATDLRSDYVTQQMLNNVFGDAATRIPDGLVIPDHWDYESLESPWDNDPKFEAWLAERQAAK